MLNTYVWSIPNQNLPLSHNDPDYHRHMARATLRSAASQRIQTICKEGKEIFTEPELIELSQCWHKINEMHALEYCLLTQADIAIVQEAIQRAVDTATTALERSGNLAP